MYQEGKWYEKQYPDPTGKRSQNDKGKILEPSTKLGRIVLLSSKGNGRNFVQTAIGRAFSASRTKDREFE